MNVVFILDKILPIPTSNVVCMKNIIDYLENRNDDVIIISQDFGGNKENQTKNIFVPKLNSKSNCMNKFISLFRFNSFNKKLVKNYYKAVVEENYKKKIDYLICVQHPYEAIKVGQQIKKQFKDIKCIAYYLDPPEGIVVKSTIKDTIKILTLKNEYKKVIKDFDKVLFPEYWKGSYCNKMRISDNDVYFVGLPNLSNKKIKSDYENDDIVRIVFAGSFYDQIRGVEFLYIIENLIQRDLKIQLHLYSKGKEEIINEFVKKYPKNIFSHGFVEQDVLNSVLKKANIFLNVSNRINTCVPGKLFEYFSYAKPIINYFYIEDDPSLVYINNYKYAYLIRENKECSIELLLNFVTENAKKNDDYEKIKEDFAKSLPEYSYKTIFT